MPWSFPGVVSNYPNFAVGSDNGVTTWGKPFRGKLVCAFGVVGGHNKQPTLEGAYYSYKLGAVACGSGEPGSTLCPTGNNLGGRIHGDVYLGRRF